MSKSSVLEYIGWPTLTWRQRRTRLQLFWQLAQGLGPPSLVEKLKLSSATSRCSYRLRNSSSVQVPFCSFCSSTARLKSFIPATSILWNSLPGRVTACITLVAFSRSIDENTLPLMFFLMVFLPHSFLPFLLLVILFFFWSSSSSSSSSSIPLSLSLCLLLFS